MELLCVFFGDMTGKCEYFTYFDPGVPQVELAIY